MSVIYTRVIKHDTRKRTWNKKNDYLPCIHCGLTNHPPKRCYKNNNKKKQKQQKTDEDDNAEFSAPFFDTDILEELESLSSNPPEEMILESREIKSPQLHFIFDSAATSHVTNNESVLTNLVSVPETTMSTALKGVTTTIRKRGTIKLNDKWKLKDVAFIAKASSNLLSEGRLCDAGFGITKTKDYVFVRSPAGKVVLKGRRWNRLWIYSVGDKSEYKKPINTLIPTTHYNQSTSSSSASHPSPNPRVNTTTSSISSSSSSGTSTIPKTRSAIKRTSKRSRTSDATDEKQEE